jgi:hypothetical protein
VDGRSLNPLSQVKEEQKMIIFENTGEIDIRAVATFGVNVKENENPIGFFGTGLKYALAVLLRTGHTVLIQSGRAVYPITAETAVVRGKKFDFVQAGTRKLGFTTELGKNWEIWMAYRELHCNMKDENGTVSESADIPAPETNKTRVLVKGEPFEKAHAARNVFLLEDSVPIYKIGTIEVYSQPSQSFFYRGIKVMDFQRPALYTYNQTGHVELTEDRTAKDPYSVVYSLSREILEHAPRPMLEAVLMAEKDNIEHQFDYHGWTSVTPGPEFFPTVAALQRDYLCKVNLTALRLWREKGGGFINPRRIQPTKLQAAMLEKAIAFCEKSGFALRNEYPILIVETLGEGGTMAMADRIGKQILLSESIFNKDGTKGVARALIEEYLHLKYKFEDCSREMQNYLFAKMVSLAEELTGEPL